MLCITLISVAAVNCVGRSLFSDPMAIEIGIGMQLLYYISSVRKCFYSVPGPSWTLHGLLSHGVLYSLIISFEIGYYAPLQILNCLGLMVETNSLTSKSIDVSNVYIY